METLSYTLQRRAEAAVSLSTVSIALCVAGAVSLVIALGVAGWVCRRHKRAKQQQPVPNSPLKEKIGEPELKSAPSYVNRATAPSRPSQEPQLRSILLNPLPYPTLSKSSFMHAPSKPLGVFDRGGPAKPQVPKPALLPSGTSARPSRIAVPSLLLQNLRELPPSHSPNQAGPPKLPFPVQASSSEVDDDAESLTPILNLDMSFPGGFGYDKPLELEDKLDLKIEKSKWMSTKLATAFDGRKSVDAPRVSSNSPTNINSALPQGMRSVESLPRPSLFGQSAPSTMTKSFTAIDMPTGSGNAGLSDHLTGFRPLSLGLSLESSSSQASLGSMLFKNVKSFWAVPAGDPSSSDIEFGGSSIGVMSREFSSDSASSSATSFTTDTETSINKATIVPAGSLPPVPPFPLHLLKQTTSASSSPQKANALLPAKSEVITRERASIFGTMTESPAKPVVAEIATQDKKSSVEAPFESQQPITVMTTLPFTQALDNGASVPPQSKTQMSFMTPYHRAVIPDPPSRIARPSLDVEGRSPILAQLGPKKAGPPVPSPSLATPRPSFSESIKAHLSMNRKSNINSPIPDSRSSSPRLSVLDLFPKPVWGMMETESDASSSSGRGSFEEGPTEQWRVSTEEDCFPNQHGLKSQNAIGLSFSGTSNFDEEEEVRESQRDTLQSNATRDVSMSPIMQDTRWAQGTSNPQGTTPETPSQGQIALANLMSQAPQRECVSLEEVGAQYTYDSQEMSKDMPHLSRMDNSRTVRISQEMDSILSPRLSSGFRNRTSIRTSVGSHILASPRSDGGADTISISSSCATDTMGDTMELAADRRAKLLASVQSNLAFDLEKDRRAMKKVLRSSQEPPQRPPRPANLGLGLFETVEESELELDELAPFHTIKRPIALALAHDNFGENDGPLTPPYTPIDAKIPLPSLPESGAPRRPSPPSAERRRLLAASAGKPGLVPLNVDAANMTQDIAPRSAPMSCMRSSPSAPSFRTFSGDSASLLPASRGLRPLSLASSSTVGDLSTPMLRKFGTFSLAMPSSPTPAFGNNRERRLSRLGQGGILPTVNSSGALETGKANHAEISSSSSKDSVNTSSTTYVSFGRSTRSSSPMRPSFSTASIARSNASVLTDLNKHVDLASVIGI